jgi:outer membrane protein
VVLLGADPAFAQSPDNSPKPRAITGLTAPQLFDIATNAQQSGDTATAETIYTALTHDPDIDIRSEARFRLSQLLETQKRYTDAALLLRAILDEKPDAQRVRLELAKVLALKGDERGAYRALRQAEAGGLPPDVALLVKQFTNAFRSHKPFGASLEISLAPDSNINRSTISDTLDTIVGPLVLSGDAKQQSGIGLKVGGQTYLRLPVAKDLRFVTRLSGQANLYRASSFNDITGSGQIGVEWTKGRSLWSPSIGRTWRWYGGNLYALTDTASLKWRRMLGKKAQLETDIAAGRSRYKLNDLQSGSIYDLSVTYERAFDARSGGSMTVSGQRQTARDAGYATASGGVGLVYWHELGKMTVFGSANVRRLEADKLIPFLKFRRRETYWRVGLGATFRQIKVAGFSPVLRLSHERNASTVGLYDYDRSAFEFGISRAF